MALLFSQEDPGQEHLFTQRFWVHTRTADNKELITLTGSVKIDFNGVGSHWREEEILLVLRLPAIIPAGKALRVEHWAPFITIGQIANEHHAVDAGYGIEHFWGPGPVTTRDSIHVRANIRVRDIDASIERVAYHITLSGVFVDYVPPPID
jgi:hypothetical protein